MIPNSHSIKKGSIWVRKYSFKINPFMWGVVVLVEYTNELYTAIRYDNCCSHHFKKLYTEDFIREYEEVDYE